MTGRIGDVTKTENELLVLRDGRNATFASVTLDSCKGLTHLLFDRIFTLLYIFFKTNLC